MTHISSITVNPEIQDGAPVFSGTRVRVETFYDYMRIGCSVREFLNEFPSVAPDQAHEVFELAKQSVTVEQLSSFAAPANAPRPQIGIPQARMGSSYPSYR